MLLELMSRQPEAFSSLTSALAQWVLAQHHGLRTRFLDIHPKHRSPPCSMLAKNAKPKTTLATRMAASMSSRSRQT